MKLFEISVLSDVVDVHSFDVEPCEEFYQSTKCDRKWNISKEGIPEFSKLFNQKCVKAFTTGDTSKEYIKVVHECIILLKQTKGVIQ